MAKTQKILVTGGAGFVGSNLVEYLTSKGYKVTVIDDLSAGSKPKWWNTSRANPIRCLEIDISAGKLESALRGIDVIVHLAAKPGVADSITKPAWEFKTNVQGTFNLIDAARKVNVKHFMFASSGAVLAEAKPPLNESMPPSPLSPYGASKVYGEAITKAAGAFGITGTSLRFSNIYGPHSTHKSSAVIVFLNAALHNKPLSVYGGAQTRDFIFVDDICLAIEKAIQISKSGTYHIGTGKETSVKTLVGHIEQIMGKKLLIKYEPARSSEAQRNYADIRLAKKVLGWSPKTDLHQGLTKTIHWLKSQAN